MCRFAPVKRSVHERADILRVMTAAPFDRLRLAALRYAVNEEAEQYVAVMRVFTEGTAGLLSDLSAREVAERLGDHHGIELDVDLVDTRLSYLVQSGNLARSPRETEARSIREYLTTRARYQLTQRGELVHRQVEELISATDEVRVSQFHPLERGVSWKRHVPRSRASSKSARQVVWWSSVDAGVL